VLLLTTRTLHPGPAGSPGAGPQQPPGAAPPAAAGTALARLYGGYALGFLALTVLAGTWLRAVFVWPATAAGASAAHLVHAHSHVAFFGWLSMALFAAIARAGRIDGARARLLRLHAHAVALASAAAFLSFLRAGYDAASIAVSALHVLLWVVFAAAAWAPLNAAGALERRFFRGALAFLLAAGAATAAPAAVLVRGVSDPWWSQFAVKLFLSPFTSGWALLGTMGALYGVAAGGRRRAANAALILVAAGVLPSTFLHVVAPPPADWIPIAGRAGTVLLGTGATLIALDLLSAQLRPLTRLAAAAALLAGTLQLAAGAGVGATLIASRPVVLAFLHLLLLGFMTPALLEAIAPPRGKATGRTAALAAGLALMLAALLALGGPPSAGSP